jgi:hypothetical protein
MEISNGHAQTLRANQGSLVAVSRCSWGTGVNAASDTWRLLKYRFAT